MKTLFNQMFRKHLNLFTKLHKIEIIAGSRYKLSAIEF